MAKARLKAGETIETLTQPEMDALLAHHLSKTTRDWFQEEARGLAPAPIEASATVANGAIAFPAPGDHRLGPDMGFAWKVERLSLTGLATGDELLVYKNNSQPGNFIDVLTPARPAIYPGKGCILSGGDTLYVTGTGLTATGALVLAGEAVECGGPDIFKIIG